MAEAAAAWEVGDFTIDPDHPVLPGHFPGQPLVPGVMLLERAMARILASRPGQRLTGLTQVKFLRPVMPGERVTVEATVAPCGGIAFTLRVGGELALRAHALLGEARP